MSANCVLSIVFNKRIALYCSFLLAHPARKLKASNLTQDSSLGANTGRVELSRHYVQ